MLDLLALLAAWTGEDTCAGCTPGVVSNPDTCLADSNLDCTVNDVDLLTLLANWGSCDGSGEAQRTGESGESEYGTVSDRWSMTKSLFDPQVIYQIAAEDLKATTSDPVTQTRWWGYYQQGNSDCESGYTDSFTVTYYDSVLHPMTGERIPGSVIASFTQQPSRMAMPDPLPNGVTLYLYTLDHAPVNLDQGGCYFVEVRNDGGGITPNGCHWYWAWSDEPEWPYSVYWIGTAGMGYDDMGDPAHESNLAFSLDVPFVRADPSILCASQ